MNLGISNYYSFSDYKSFMRSISYCPNAQQGRFAKQNQKKRRKNDRRVKNK